MATSTATRPVDIKGRSVQVKNLVDAQMVLIGREARLLQRDDVPGQRKLDAIARTFDILESVVVDDGDRDYLLNLIVAGQLDLQDLMGFILPPATEEKPKVRRGRPPIKRA